MLIFMLLATQPDPARGGYKGQPMCGVYQPTRVISTSYGEAEADLPINYQKRQCSEFMKLGLQGHTFFFSSGDYGVVSQTDRRRVGSISFPLSSPLLKLTQTSGLLF